MFGNWIKRLYLLKQATYHDSTDNDRIAVGIIGEVQVVDASGNPASLGGGAGGGNNTYTTASGQITATANSGGKTITLRSLPFTLTDEMVAGGTIKKIDSSGDVTSLALTNITVSGDVITLGDIDDFVSGDEVSVVLVAQDKAYDANQDVDKISIENPDSDKYTDPEPLVSASDIGATDDTWVDQGAEIDCRGFKTIGIWVNLTVNDSTGNQLQVLVKHESGGTDEYTLDTSSEYQKNLGNADRKPFYEFGVEGIIHIQIQTKATDVDTGGGTEGTVTIEITKEY